MEDDFIEQLAKEGWKEEPKRGKYEKWNPYMAGFKAGYIKGNNDVEHAVRETGGKE